MRNQIDKILRLVVLGLALLVLVQLIRAGFRANPLAWVKIPPVPTLETNSPASSNSNAVPKMTNASSVKIANTNSTKSATLETNLSPDKTAKASQSNAAPIEVVMTKTNSDEAKPFSQDVTNFVGVMTNSSVSSTNVAVVKSPVRSGTNDLLTKGTNLIASAKPPKKSQSSPRSGMPMAGGMVSGGFPGMSGMNGSGPKLPPEIQQRVDKIVDSEIFAPVMHPMPAALLGIAGDTAFLRSASGQTGLAKAGDSVGEMKVVRIGINRVLVEQGGQNQELMIFNGYGGESLLSKQSENSK